MTTPAVAAAVAAPVAVAAIVKPDEETLEAMRWACAIKEEVHVLELIEALPKRVVEEQVMLYRKRDQAMEATQIQPPPKIRIGSRPRYETRMDVAKRFHDHLREEGFDNAHKLPYGEISRFILCGQSHLLAGDGVDIIAHRE